MQQSQELRQLKEQFVSNLQGTTKWEVFCVITCLPLCPLVAAYTEAWLAARASRGLPRPLQLLARTPPKFVLEFGIVVVPQVLLLMSVAPPEPAFLLLFLLWGSLALKLWMKLAHSPGSKQHMAHMLQHINAPRKRFVSAFRGGVMLSTCLAILAVDFTAFPRRYAKAETAGAGVMDVGVGAIVWAGGLVSAAAAAAATATAAGAAAAGGEQGGGSGGNGGTGVAASAGLSGSGGCAGAGPTPAAGGVAAWLLRLLRGARAAVPLVVLGCGRLLATRAVGYQQHLGEYGLSWNFFHTIAAVGLLTLAAPLPPAWLAPAGLAVSGLHQLLLSADLGLTPVGPLGAWMAAELGEDQRRQDGFLAANKEGLGSLPGYWALHLLGAAAGHQLAVSCGAATARARASLVAGSKGAGGGLAAGGPARAAAAVGECARQVWSWVGAWLLLDLALWAAAAAAEAWLEPVSRRSCNLAYVLWTCAQCLAWLLLCLIGDMLTSGLGSSSSSQAPPVGISARRTAATTTGSLPAAGAAATAPAAAAGQRLGSRRKSSSSPTAAAAAARATANGAAAAGAGAEGSSAYGAPPPPTKGGQHQRQPQQPQQAAAATGQGSPSSSTSSGSSGTLATAAAASLRQRRRSSSTRQSAAVAAPPVAAISSSSSGSGPSRLLVAFNRNMLALFLAANLLTGAVNLSVNTLSLGNWEARAVVGCYMLVLCGLAVKLDAAGITLKPW